MTLLQVRTSPPQAVKASDVTGLFDSVMSAVGSAIPKLIVVAYFIVAIVILWRIGKTVWNRQTASIPTMEWIALGIMFGLMK